MAELSRYLDGVNVSPQPHCCVFFIVLVATVAGLAPLPAQLRDKKGLDGLKAVSYDQLSEKAISNLGLTALGVSPETWNHAETENFIYHYRNSFVGTPVSVEAEFYYRVISGDLKKDTASWERKCRIFVFEESNNWDEFKVAGELDPWTGGLHVNNELYIKRDPSYKWQDHILGHEVAHLVIDRFYGGSSIPLWLNEGYSEFISRIAYASYWRARDEFAKPTSPPVPLERFMPLQRLTSFRDYPRESELDVFYGQSEKLVRFLRGKGQDQFVKFFDSMARGARLETALSSAYGSELATIAQLEKQFMDYSGRIADVDGRSSSSSDAPTPPATTPRQPDAALAPKKTEEAPANEPVISRPQNDLLPSTLR